MSGTDHSFSKQFHFLLTQTVEIVDGSFNQRSQPVNHFGHFSMVQDESENSIFFLHRSYNNSIQFNFIYIAP